MRRRRRQRGLGGFGEIRLAAPWEKVGPLTFVRKEDFGGGCREVVAAVTCPPRMRKWKGSEAGRLGRFQCAAEVRYYDPQTETKQQETIRTRHARTVDAAAESAILQAELAVSRLRTRCRQDVRYPVRYPGFAPELVWEEESVLLPACECESKWTKRGFVVERECGSGFSMHVARTGFSLRDPLHLMLRQRGEKVWQGEHAPEFQGHDERGRELWESQDDALKDAKKKLMTTLKAVCEAESEEDE